MLYLGHFSFAYESLVDATTPEPWHGRFTALVEAASISAAMRKFEALIKKTAGSMDLFDEVDEIFLDSCIEVKSIPRAGLLGLVALQEGESSGTISTTLPGVPEKYGASYQLEPETTEEDGSYAPEPFMVLKRRRPAPRPDASRKHVH